MKDEGLIPTGTFKARGAAVGVSRARELGVKAIAMPTNGNAGAAWSVYAARAGLGSLIVMPVDAPEITRRECVAAGAELYLVDGLINHAGALVKAAVEERSGYQEVSTLKEPYRIEGKKTMGYEIAEQLGWRVPDVILYPAGGGVGLIGIHKAMLEMRELGWIGEALPRLVAVQSTGCPPIVTAYDAGLDESTLEEGTHTLAFGINVPKALGDFLVLQGVRESEGTAVAVSDEAILTELGNLAAAEGTWICPEGAACLAAARELRESGWIREDERVVVLNTGAGLKYPETVPVDVPVLPRDGVSPAGLTNLRSEKRLDEGELPLQAAEVRRDGGVAVLAGERALSPGHPGECPLRARQGGVRRADLHPAGDLLTGGDTGGQTQEVGVEQRLGVLAGVLQEEPEVGPDGTRAQRPPVDRHDVVALASGEVLRRGVAVLRHLRQRVELAQECLATRPQPVGDVGHRRPGERRPPSATLDLAQAVAELTDGEPLVPAELGAGEATQRVCDVQTVQGRVLDPLAGESDALVVLDDIGGSREESGGLRGDPGDGDIGLPTPVREVMRLGELRRVVGSRRGESFDDERPTRTLGAPDADSRGPGAAGQGEPDGIGLPHEAHPGRAKGQIPSTTCPYVSAGRAARTPPLRPRSAPPRSEAARGRAPS